MTDLVSGWKSEIGHIVDTDDEEEVKTRCGRTLRNFYRGASGFRNCAKCGSEADFEAVWEEKRQAHILREAKRKEENAKRQASSGKRLETHRQLMRQFEAMLVKHGAEIKNVRQQSAGGKIEFKKDGLNFKLSGNIF